MVTDRLADGVRIAELLASEVTGNESRLRGLTVADADRDAEPTADGALAYRIVREGDDRGSDEAESGEAESRSTAAVAEVYVHSDRARIEVIAAAEAAAAAAREVDLRVRPKAARPPQTLVFVEDGAQVKRALTVLEAVRNASGEE